MKRAAWAIGHVHLSAVVIALLTTAASWSQTLIWLGRVERNNEQDGALSVSADGTVVVGSAIDPANRVERAFRWTAAGGMQFLGTLGGSRSRAYGVSDDGSVVAGWAQISNGSYRAFRWTAVSGMQSLGTLGGYSNSLAFGISADGLVVVGRLQGFFVWDPTRAFRWTASGGLRNLGTFGGSFSGAVDVSADGSVVVGWAYNTAGNGRAFRWTQSTGLQDLGTLGGCCSEASGVSADGSVVVGSAQNAGGQNRAFRWTASGGMQDLGTLGGNASWAWGVSADGSVVVGYAQNADGQWRAFRWTASGGMEDLNTTYASLLTPDSYLEWAFDISADGRCIVGRGWNAVTGSWEAYLLETSPRCTQHNGDVDNNGCVDDADLLAVLFAFGDLGSNLGRVDVNCDQVVDDADLLQVLFNFGSGC